MIPECNTYRPAPGRTFLLNFLAPIPGDGRPTSFKLQHCQNPGTESDRKLLKCLRTCFSEEKATSKSKNRNISHDQRRRSHEQRERTRSNKQKPRSKKRAREQNDQPTMCDGKDAVDVCACVRACVCVRLSREPVSVMHEYVFMCMTHLSVCDRCVCLVRARVCEQLVKFI